MKKLAIAVLLAALPIGAGQYMRTSCLALPDYILNTANVNCQNMGGCTSDQWELQYELAYNQIMVAWCFTGQ